MEHLADYLRVFIAIYVLVNPLEGIPIYLARTQGLSTAQRLAIARTTSIAVAIILWVSLAIGHVILQVLSISVGAFTLAGGVIIFIIALKMVLGPQAGADQSQGPADGSFAIVPLAIPLLAGPGPISSVIVFASKGIAGGGPSWSADLILAVIILVVALATFAAIAVDLINEGLQLLYPHLAN